MLKKSVIIFILGFSFSGCSQIIKFKKSETLLKKEEPTTFSCEDKAPPRSLQELEKKYRCTGG